MTDSKVVQGRMVDGSVVQHLSPEEAELSIIKEAGWTASRAEYKRYQDLWIQAAVGDNTSVMVLLDYLEEYEDVLPPDWRKTRQYAIDQVNIARLLRGLPFFTLLPPCPAPLYSVAMIVVPAVPASNFNGGTGAASYRTAAVFSQEGGQRACLKLAADNYRYRDPIYTTVVESAKDSLLAENEDDQCVVKVVDNTHFAILEGSRRRSR